MDRINRFQLKEKDWKRRRRLYEPKAYGPEEVRHSVTIFSLPKTYHILSIILPFPLIQGIIGLILYVQLRKRKYKIKGPDPEIVNLFVSYFEDKKHLPIVNLRKAS